MAVGEEGRVVASEARRPWTEPRRRVRLWCLTGIALAVMSCTDEEDARLGRHDSTGAAGQGATEIADGGAGGGGNDESLPLGEMLSRLTNAQAERLCDEALGVTQGSMSDPAWRDCLTPLTYRAVCDATVQDYLDCVTHGECADYEAMCPQVLEAPALPRGMWALGTLAGESLDLRWGTYVHSYVSTRGGSVGDLGDFQLSATFADSLLYLFGSIPETHYRGLLGRPSSAGSIDWYCLGDTQVHFDQESSWQSGDATFRGFSAGGISEIGSCDSTGGTPYTLTGPHVDKPTPVCDEHWCIVDLDSYISGPGRTTLVMVRSSTPDEMETSPSVTAKVVHIAESFLVQRGGNGSVVCGSGGTITFATTDSTGPGSPVQHVEFEFTVQLDHLSSSTAVVCPGTDVQGSLNATVADFE